MHWLLERLTPASVRPWCADADTIDFDGFLRLLKVASSTDHLDQVRSPPGPCCVNFFPIGISVSFIGILHQYMPILKNQIRFQTALQPELLFLSLPITLSKRSICQLHAAGLAI